LLDKHPDHDLAATFNHAEDRWLLNRAGIVGGKSS
jgi:ABC-type cobalamin transport system ATPase subunit